jgi:hypothetical protein
MNTPVLAVIIAVALTAGSALAIMNKAAEGYRALCAPISTLQHHYSAGCLIMTADLRIPE